MIEYSLHESEYLNVCKHYRQIYDTPVVKEDQVQAKKVNLNLTMPLRPVSSVQWQPNANSCVFNDLINYFLGRGECCPVRGSCSIRQ